MSNALVDGSPPSKKSKLSKVPPGGPKQDESKNVRKVKGGENTGDEERMEKASSALRTLMESARIAKDKALMKDVHKLASEHMASISEILNGPVKRTGKGRR
jgi:hypothetical protein